VVCRSDQMLFLYRTPLKPYLTLRHWYVMLSSLRYR
jgi:hypothetical protein